MNGERALIERAMGGESEALDTLFATHRPLVVRTARAILGDPDTAEDVAQEACLRLHHALPSLRGTASLSTWLYRVTLNLCNDHLRKRRVARLDDQSATFRVADALRVEGGADHTLDADRASAAVREAVERLSADQKEVIMLRFVSDLSYAEIARITSAPEGTVASRVFRALKRLGEDLEPRHLEVVK